MRTTRYGAAMHASRSIPEFVKECRVVAKKTKDSTDLTNPPVPLADVVLHINALDDAEQAAHNGALGAASDRDAKLVVVQCDMDLFKAYAESVANANPERGAA